MNYIECAFISYAFASRFLGDLYDILFVDSNPGSASELCGMLVTDARRRKSAVIKYVGRKGRYKNAVGGGA